MFRVNKISWIALYMNPIFYPADSYICAMLAGSPDEITCDLDYIWI